MAPEAVHHRRGAVIGKSEGEGEGERASVWVRVWGRMRARDSHRVEVQC